MKCHGIAMKLDQKFWNARLLLDCKIRYAFDSRHHVPDLRAFGLEHIEIGAKHFHHDGGRCSHQRLFNALGDELHDIECEPDDAFELMPHIVNHFLARPRAVIQIDVQFRDIWAKSVLAELGPAGPLGRLQCLRNLFQPALDDGSDAHGFFE